MKKKHRFLPYRQAVPSFLLFQILSAAALGIWMVLFRGISMLLLHSAGKVAVTSGDLAFLFTTWQGIVLILLALLTLFVFLSVDINALIILCNRLLKGEKPSVLRCIKEGFVSIRRFLNPRGIAVALYLSIFAPIIGFGVSISLTQNLYIPKFITSVIFKNPFYTIGSAVVILLLLLLGIIYIFIIHGVLIDKMKIGESAKNSVRLIKHNLKNFIVEMLLFILIFAAIALVFVVVFILIPSMAITVLPVADEVAISLTTAFFFVYLFIGWFILLMSLPCYLLKLTDLYLTYQSENDFRYQMRKKRVSPLVIVVSVLAVIITAFMSWALPQARGELFDDTIETHIIAHRAGGVEAPENTLAGVDAACLHHASGAEIDIQRTSDGAYVVNHDATFERTAGVSKKPSEMTLAEVKELRVDNEPVPTLEEMLESCRGRIILFVELKGETADRQMADDAVRIIKEKNMADQSVIISLQYDLIDYIETTYPEMLTGYLAFVSFGDTAALNCDYIALEEESVNSVLLESVHRAGKAVLVWTVNEDDDIRKFMINGSDAIITDQVSRSESIRNELQARTAFRRTIDALQRMFEP